MKCKTCKYYLHHSPGTADDIINFGDDPYDYDHCEFLYWSHEPNCDPGFDPEKCKSYDLKTIK